MYYPRKLWTIKGTSWNFCPHIKNIREIINEEKSQGFDTVLISCGTNDIEYKSGIEVHTELMPLIKFINEKYPTLKIIISHITPRKDDLNKEALVCYALLDQSVKQSEHVFLVDHSNLQSVNPSIDPS